MNNYHVLSNNDIIEIVFFAIFTAVLLAVVFAKLGRRNPSPSYKKGTVAKIVPWVLLLLFVSDMALIISRLIAYPWDIDPQPSNASAFREIQSLVIDTPVWGWANDYQMDIVGKIGGCLFTLCWTTYAFCFKRSDTNWWRKVFKVIAYILLSVLIIGFSFHEMRELLFFIVLIVAPSILLLFLARVKPTKTNIKNAPTDTTKEQPLVVDAKNTNDIYKEDASRFQPHIVNKDPLDTNYAIGRIEENDFVATNISKGEQQQDNQKDNTQDKDEMRPIEELDIAVTEYNPEVEVEHIVNIPNSMFCKYCGKEIESDSAYCKYCGRKLS